MEATDVQENWLDKVHDIISWQVAAPKIHTPFSTGIPTPLLRRFVNEIDTLKKHVGLKGLVDGHEFIFITNVSSLSFFSDHYIVSAMTKKEIRRYLEDHGIMAWVLSELAILQKEYAEELAKRSSTAEHEKQTEKVKKKAGPTREKQEVRQGQFNRFYSGGQKNG